jgi:putative aldouronate transport system permease protein
MRHNTLGGKIFDGFNYLFLAMVAMVMIVPLLYIIAGSFASDSEISSRAFFIIPEHATLNAYKYVFKDNTLPRSLMVSIFVTVFGTIVNLLFTLSLAYALSRKHMPGRTLFINLIILTLVFNGGLIPTYLVVKNLGLLDSYLVLMLPVAINTYNLIIIKSFFQELPAEILEAARIDGCTDLRALWHIVLPLSKPIIATFSLFYAVEHWNDFFNALMYMNDMKKWPLQVLLRQIVLLATGNLDIAMDDATYVKPPDQSIKMAVVVVGTVPILLIYPFLQKYFAKGVLIGAIKG